MASVRGAGRFKMRRFYREGTRAGKPYFKSR